MEAGNMDCIETEELLSKYIENELKEKVNIDVEGHLKNCPSCNGLYKSLKILINDGSALSEEVPFFLKNRLLYIPELVENQEEEPASNLGLKFIAAMIGTFVLLLNIFYFTNIYPKGNYFLHKTMSKIERFALDTKEYVFQKESLKNNFVVAFIDKNIFNNDEDHYIKWNEDNINGSGNG